MAEIKISKMAEPESWGQWGARNVARTATSAAAQVMGLPGDIVGTMEAGVRGAQTGLSKLTGGYIPEPINKERVNPFVTSSEFKQKFNEASGDYLKPKGWKEELATDVTDDIASAMTFGGAGAKTALKLGLGGNLASWVAKDVGAPEWVQGAAKIGFNVLASTAGTRKALVKNQDILEEGMHNAIRPVERFRTSKLDPIIEKSKKISKYAEEHKSEWGKPVAEEVEKVARAMDGKSFLKIEASVPLERTLTENLRAGKYPKKAIKYVEELRDGLKEAHHEFAKKENLEFGKYYLPWSDVDNGLSTSSAVGKFINENVNLDFSGMNKYTKAAFAGSSWLHGVPIATTAALAGAAKSGLNLFSLLAKSPVARKAYENVFKASLARNAAIATTNIKKFNSEADKFYPEGEIKISKLRS